MQHELIGYVERFLRAIEFTEEGLGLDLIAEVGPGGTFMDQEHTARHFRKELWFPRLLDREFYDAWVGAGRRTMADRCRAEKDRLLQEHQPVPLPEEVDREIARILASARKELEESGGGWRRAE